MSCTHGIAAPRPGPVPARPAYQLVRPAADSVVGMGLDCLRARPQLAAPHPILSPAHARVLASSGALLSPSTYPSGSPSGTPSGIGSKAVGGPSPISLLTPPPLPPSGGQMLPALAAAAAAVIVNVPGSVCLCLYVSFSVCAWIYVVCLCWKVLRMCTPCEHAGMSVCAGSNSLLSLCHTQVPSNAWCMCLRPSA
jgi:hypothetical protein